MFQIRTYGRIILISIPSIIAIMLVETVNVLMYVQGPLQKSIYYLIIWLVLQTISGFIFAYISDRHFRKLTLVISQSFGVLGGLTLYFFHHELWAVLLIAVIFNPLPVARAALLDNFPRQRSLRIIAITFIAQWFPWIFLKQLTTTPFKGTVLCILLALAANIFLTIFLFKDHYDKFKTHAKNIVFEHKNKINILLIISAFILAETTFYLMADFLEYEPKIRSWLSTTTLGTILGILIAMMYSKLPHLSIITLCYSIGVAAMLSAIGRCLLSANGCSYIFVNTMSQFTIIGGLYLPFVTDGVIGLLGSQNKALGSAVVELGDTIASLLAPIINIILNSNSNSKNILVVFSMLYLIAAVLQKRAEKTKILKH